LWSYTRTVSHLTKELVVTSGPKEREVGEVGGQQQVVLSTKEDSWAPSKLEELRRQKDVEMSSSRMSTPATGTPPRKRRNNGTSVGYSGRTALRREKYAIFTHSKN
jgi:hypothetical protein